jgi:hypothetical protein
MVKTVLVGLAILALIGSASAAPDTKTPETNLVGVYACEGTNPDGKTYSGIVEIIKHRDAYLIRWTMPDESQVVGVGIFTGGMLSVSYFGGTPSLVVYSIAENGRLTGTWTAVGAEGALFTETLTRLPEGAAPKPPKPTKRESQPRPRITV